MKGILCPLIGVIGFLTISIVPIFADDSLPVLKYFQVDEYNNVIQPYNKVDEALSQTTVDVAHLRLECHANYPVQWIFTRNGVCRKCKKFFCVKAKTKRQKRCPL